MVKETTVRETPFKATFMTFEETGLVTNSILFCRLFTIKDRCKQMHFQQTHNQGLRQMLLTVSWDLRP